MSTTNWIFEGRGTYAEFQEVIDRDSAGALVSQKIQKRDVLTFRRYQIVTATVPMTLPETDVGNVLAGGLSAYQGSALITAIAVLTSGKRKWVCTVDDHPDDGVGVNWITRHQTWESRSEWEDYDWPEV